MVLIDPHSPAGQSLLATALESMDEGAAILGPDLTFQWVNKWMEARFSGYSPLEGKKCRDLFGAGEAVCEGCPVSTGIPAEATVSRATEHTLVDGSTCWLEVSVSPLWAAGGEPAGAIVRFRDVSGPIHNEEVLRAEISFRRTLVEQSSDGIVVLDEEGSVVESNLHFAQMIGYSMEEMLSLHVWDWESQFPRAEVLEMLKAVDSSGAAVTTRHRRKDGTFYEVDIHTNGAVIGGRKYIFCICRDITEAKRAEREREALIQGLRDALAEIKVLRGIVPVCSYCKKVRDDEGYWEQVDVYMQKHAIADVSHGICPDCLKSQFPELSRDS